MNKNVIDDAFSKLIHTRGIHEELGITNSYVTTLRNKLKTGTAISTDTKIKLLQKSGWSQDDRLYNRKDLIDLLKFNARTSQAARDQGPEYVIEKWEESK